MYLGTIHTVPYLCSDLIISQKYAHSIFIRRRENSFNLKNCHITWLLAFMTEQNPNLQFTIFFVVPNQVVPVDSYGYLRNCLRRLATSSTEGGGASCFRSTSPVSSSLNKIPTVWRLIHRARECGSEFN